MSKDPGHDFAEFRISEIGAADKIIHCSIGQEVWLGGSADCDLMLEYEEVSCRVARLMWENLKLFVEPVEDGAPSSLFINGALVTGPTPVAPGEVLRLGSASIIWRRLLSSDMSTLVQTRPALHRSNRNVQSVQEVTTAERYQVAEELGHGGMGRVLRAEEKPLQRSVAMKVLFAGASEQQQYRLIEEARVTGQLEHPGIVPVHELGVDASGKIFYTMKMVQGRTLGQVLRQIEAKDPMALAHFDLTSLLMIFQKVCDAVAFAHSRRVIHRDLKPENVMVGEFGEVLVMDWGLSKVLNTDHEEPFVGTDGATDRQRVRSLRGAASHFEHSVAGQVMGTLSYMAPEQARGEVRELDERTDIYALGGILHAILTLHPPAELELCEAGSESPAGHADPRTRLLECVGTGNVVPRLRKRDQLRDLPHLPDGTVPDSLSAVALKALAFAPQDRYLAVLQLQQDVAAFQGGFVTSVEDAGVWRHLRLFVRRHRAASFTTLGGLLLIALLSGVYAWRLLQERDQTRQQRDIAQSSSKEAIRQRDHAESRLYHSHMLLCTSELAEGRPENARQLLDRHRREPSGRDLRDWEWYFLHGRVNQDTRRVIAHAGGSHALTVSHNGQWIATTGEDGGVAVWQTRDFQNIARWRAHDAAGTCIAWDTEDHLIATGCLNGTVGVWDVATRKLVARQSLLTGNAVRTVAWEPLASSEARLAMAGASAEIWLWKPLVGENSVAESFWPSPETTGRSKAINSLSWSRDGKFLGAGLLDHSPSIAVFDMGAGKATFTHNAPTGSDVYAVAFHPQANVLAAGAKHLFVSAYNVEGGKEIFSRPVQNGFVTAIAWSPKGDRIASAGYDGAIRISEAASIEKSRAVLLAGHQGGVHALAWGSVPTPSGTEVALVFSTGEDGTLRAWHVENAAGEWKAEHIGWVSEARWSPDGSTLAVIGFQNVLYLFDALNFRLRKLPVGGGKTFGIAWSPDSSKIAVACLYSGTVRVVDVSTGQELSVFDQPKAHRVAWHPDGKLLACGSRVDTRVWDVSSRSTVCIIPRSGGRTAWHPDGRRLAIGTYEGALEIWDGRSGKPLAVWREMQPAIPGEITDDNSPLRLVHDLAWSPQGDRLAFVTQNTHAAILDASTGAVLQEFTGHTGGIWCLAWNASGHRLATGGQDGTVRIYDSVTGDQMATVPHGDGHNEISTMQWSPDGLRLVTGGFDGFVRVWDSRTGHTLERIASLEESLRHKPKSLELLLELAALHAKAGNADIARATVENARGLFPAEPRVARMAESVAKELSE